MSFEREFARELPSALTLAVENDVVVDLIDHNKKITIVMETLLSRPPPKEE